MEMHQGIRKVLNFLIQVTASTFLSFSQFKKITPDILAMQRSYSVEVLNIRNNAYSNLKPRFDLATAASFVVIDDLIACYNA